MKRIFGAASVLAILSANVATAAPSTFQFSVGNWSDGGIFSGFFEGEDLNGDNQITFFGCDDDSACEVTDFNATYQSSNIFAEFDYSSLNGVIDEVEDEVPAPDLLSGLVFTLDGTGRLGDDEFGNVEGLAVSNGDFYYSHGPGPEALCDGFNPCGAIYDAQTFIGRPNVETDGPIQLLNDDVVRIDEVIPGPLAFTSDVIQVTTGDLGDLGSEDNPFLPDEIDEETGGFVFGVPGGFDRGEIFFIDPEIATGYTYTITGNTFLSVQLPSLATVPDGDGQYSITVNGFTTDGFLAGSIVFFEPSDNVTEFTITGIDVALALDPNDPLAFVTGVSVGVPGQGTITQTPITTQIDPIPLPAGGLLLLSGLAGLALARRRRG